MRPVFIKKNWYIFVGLLCVAILILFRYAVKKKEGADTPAANVPKKVKVLTTILPLYLAVKEVGGQWVEVVNIAPLHADPHTFPYRDPQNLNTLQGTDMLFTTGTNLDAGAEQAFQSLQSPKVVEIGKSLSLLPPLPSVRGKNIKKGEEDPHFWLDPRRMRIAVLIIRDSLIEVDQERRRHYEAQTSAFLENIDTIDRDFRERFKGVKSRDIVSSHNFMTYFVDSYILNWVGALPGISEAAPEPAPQYISELIQQMKRGGVTSIFAENPESVLIRNIAAKTNARIYRFNPLEFATNTEVKYDTVMRENMKIISDALGYEPK